MQIDEVEIPEVVIVSWKSWIDRLSPAMVKELAAGRPAVMNGFRPTAIDVTVARTRLKAALVQSSELPMDLQAAIASACLANSLLTVLSEAALKLTAAPLSIFFGVSEIAASMLLDERMAVRDQGRSLLAEWDGTEPTPSRREAARTELLALIGPFLSHMLALQPPEGNVAGGDIAGGLEPPAALPPGRPPRPARDAELVKALRDTRKNVSRLNRENGAVTAKLATSQSEAKAAKVELANKSDRLADVEVRLDTLTSRFDAEVRQAVQGQLDDRLLPWLRPAEALAAAAQALQVAALPAASAGGVRATDGDSEPVRTAKQLLLRQAEVDRQFGLRRALRTEREHCQFLRESLREAHAESIRPLADLTPGIHALDARIRQIETALGENQSTQTVRQSPALTRLESALATADSLDEVTALRRGLMNSEPLGMLDDEELTQAYRHVAQASSRMYARAMTEPGWSMGGQELNGIPLYAIQSRLAQGLPCTVIVDGHNVLWKVPVLFGQHFEQGLPGRRARQALEAALATLARQHPNLMLHLWFDSNVMQDMVLAPNLRVHFSGGVGENRADRQMLAYLAHMSATGTKDARAVVTADRDVAATAHAGGALSMSPQELAIWIG